MLAARLLPLHDATVSLMLDHDALLECGVKIFAAITSVHWDLHAVKLVLSMLFGLERVVRNANVVVEKRHFRLLTNNKLYFISLP